MGSSGLEPPTSRLSGVRSNHLSYEPILFCSQRSVLACHASSDLLLLTNPLCSEIVPQHFVLLPTIPAQRSFTRTNLLGASFIFIRTSSPHKNCPFGPEPQKLNNDRDRPQDDLSSSDLKRSFSCLVQICCSSQIPSASDSSRSTSCCYQRLLRSSHLLGQICSALLSSP